MSLHVIGEQMIHYFITFNDFLYVLGIVDEWSWTENRSLRNTSQQFHHRWCVRTNTDHLRSLVEVRMKPNQRIISNIEAMVENVKHDLMVHCVESCGHVEKHQSANLATIDHLNHIIIYIQSRQHCLRGVVATVRRLIVRGQVVRVRVGDKPTIKQAATAGRKAICDHYSGLERRIIDSNNLGQFYRYVNRKLSSKTGIGIIKDSSGKFVSDPVGQGDAFNKFFADSFVTDNNSIPPFPSRTPPDVGLANIKFSERDVYMKLKNLKTNSAGGPDLLCPMFLKNVSYFSASPLAFMFEEFFKNSYVPSIWRTAYVRPIFKCGDATSINNYRPISLTCTCCKLMESIINDQLVDYLFTNDLITKHQHGFIKKRSTCTQLLESFQDWTLALNDKKCLDVLYLDFSRAFDTLVHSKLLHKLCSYGVQHELLNWIRSFLSGRSQRVLIDGHLSFSANVTSGIGQGSILGPSFFCPIYKRYYWLFWCLSTCKLYADDVKLYTSFNHHLGPDSLLVSLAKVQKWAIDWQLKLNPLKCSVLHLGSRNPQKIHMSLMIKF